MNTITEQELKDRCTPDAIKWMVELAEGFEWIDKDEYNNKYFVYCPVNDKDYHDIINCSITFSTLIRRAVDGWNKKNGNGISTHYDCILYNSETPKLYKFINYQKENLTQSECACFALSA